MGSTSERLPSFKGPRDLSLSSRGGKKDAPSPAQAQTRPKRVFTPNIPPKRERGAGSSNASSTLTGSSKESFKSQESDRGRPNTGRGGRGGRGGGRQVKQRGELVQTESIFAEGMGNPMDAKRSSASQYKSGYGGGRYKSAESGTSRMSSVNRAAIIKEEDEESNKKLFGNQKFDEDQEELDIDNPNIPVALPLMSYVPEFFVEPAALVSTTDPDLLNVSQIEPVPSSSTSSAPEGITIKQEKMDGDEIQATSSTPVVVKQENSVESDEIRKANEVKTLLSMPLEPASFAGTFRTVPVEGTLAIFQLPDELPVLNDSVRDAENQNSDKSSATGLVQSIDDLPDGFIGRFEIMSTGRTRFILGENIFDVEPGRLVGFRQEYHAADVENKTLTNLGPINRKFVITPDIGYLIND